RRRRSRAIRAPPGGVRVAARRPRVRGAACPSAGLPTPPRVAFRRRRVDARDRSDRVREPAEPGALPGVPRALPRSPAPPPRRPAALLLPVQAHPLLGPSGGLAGGSGRRNVSAALSFHLVDRIVEIDLERSVRGTFAIPTDFGRFPACLIVEAIGQLASWVA